MILHRCFAWNERARPDEPDGALWFPRPYQGDGRHDNPDLYGCLYAAEDALSCVVEQLARFRTQRLIPSLLRRRDLPLSLAEIELPEDESLIDLDAPRTLARERLRPSEIATRHRDVTQPQARRLHEAHPDAAGLRWWSTFESLWANVTIFDRAASRLRVRAVRELTLDDPYVVRAADFFGVRH
ncbi:MAG TPA: RES family NAD+ phosphorylase [Candidatus Binatia bacterium]|nr:RES family NAD+ phosphorylase [Candidatus Binatia bacterium]